MTKQELISHVSYGFTENYASEKSAFVVEHNCVDTLYELAMDRYDAPAATRSKVTFRAAYVLETIYFDHPHIFSEQLRRQFMKDFASTTNESAKRHFTKMMNHILTHTTQNTTTPQQAEDIAQAAALWATEPKARVAVKIGAINILRTLQGRVTWIDEIMPTLLEAVRNDQSPAIMVNLRHWSGKR